MPFVEMARKIISVAWRYLLPLLAFALILLVSYAAREFFSLSLDLTALVIVLMVATAWYLGIGPGLLTAVVFELMINFLSPTPKSVFITINRMVLFVCVVLFAGSRRKAEKRLREQSELLQVALEREQAAREEAEVASRLKDDFLATVSHELRSPLSAILGWATMLNKNKLDDETARSALATIERNARAQAGIVNDILDVSRIINGKLQINSKPVAVAPLIGEAIETLRPAAIAKSITINVALDDAAGSRVVGDANRLRQIVWNLISNAIKFTPENGRVEVGLKQIDSHVEIRVSDTGEGISKEFLPHVFERFRQGDSSTTRAQGGLGLGLSIVRHLIELHGGTVTAESEGANRGAAFTVRLPLAENVENSIPPQQQQQNGEAAAIGLNSLRDIAAGGADAPDIRGLRVLVVDDDPDTLEVLRVVLKQYGARVRIAVSTADALEVFREWKPDVLISDLAMPVEDGYALISKIRALAPEQGGNVPAAALTAYSTEIDRSRSRDAGYQIHIAKPLDPTIIAAAVAEIKKKI